MQSLLRISLTVSDLAAMTAFYVEALGFVVARPPRPAEPVMTELFGVRALQSVLLHRGHQCLELVACDPPGAPYPPGSRSNDAWFQHCALVVDDMAVAYARLCHSRVAAISRNGPQRLPGGLTAFKFRDPDGHPLELIEFPAPQPATACGIDHSAIAVMDIERSIVFYTEVMGLAVGSWQTNTGPAQDALDGLDNTVVDVVGLTPAQPAPHVELLCYRRPPGRPRPAMQPADIAASRLVVLVDRLPGGLRAVRLADGVATALSHDPDGHLLQLIAGSADA